MVLKRAAKISNVLNIFQSECQKMMKRVVSVHPYINADINALMYVIDAPF